jgi:hypothetical protein
VIGNDVTVRIRGIVEVERLTTPEGAPVIEGMWRE